MPFRADVPGFCVYHLVDTNVADDTFTRWAINGLGRVTLETTRPLIPAAQFVDDRPWIIAHGNGHVFYFGNEGDKTTYPLGTQGIGCGPGRYTVYPSLEVATPLIRWAVLCPIPVGAVPPAITAPATTWCTLSADGGSDDLISPINPLGTLYSYTSPDDGQTWTRSVVGSYVALVSELVLLNAEWRQALEVEPGGAAVTGHPVP